MPIIFLIGVIFQFLSYPFQFFADGSVRQHFIITLLKSGTIEPMKYSMVGPLLSSPLAFADIVLNSNFWLLRYNFLVLCIAAYFLYKLLYSEKEKYFLLVFMILIFFASLFPGHIIHYYGEVFSALFMSLGILLIEKRRTAIGWLLMILSVGNTPATFFPLLLVCAYKVIKDKNLSYILLPALAAVTLFLESKARMPKASLGFTNYLLDDHGFRSILPYSGRSGFSYPIILGLLGELFSFGKGLLFFTPGLLFIPIVLHKLNNRYLRKIFLLWLVYLVGLILVYSKWWAWYGGWFWGPRFLLFASIPASFALAFVLTQETNKKIRFAALGVALWSFWVGISGVVFAQTGLDVCTANNYALEHLCWYVPEFSALFHPFVAKSIPADLTGCLIVLISLLLWIMLALKNKTVN